MIPPMMHLYVLVASSMQAAAALLIDTHSVSRFELLTPKRVARLGFDYGASGLRLLGSVPQILHHLKHPQAAVGIETYEVRPYVQINEETGGHVVGFNPQQRLADSTSHQTDTALRLCYK